MALRRRLNGSWIPQSRSWRSLRQGELQVHRKGRIVRIRSLLTWNGEAGGALARFAASGRAFKWRVATSVYHSSYHRYYVRTFHNVQPSSPVIVPNRTRDALRWELNLSRGHVCNSNHPHLESSFPIEMKGKEMPLILTTFLVFMICSQNFWTFHKFNYSLMARLWLKRNWDLTIFTFSISFHILLSWIPH